MKPSLSNLAPERRKQVYETHRQLCNRSKAIWVGFGLSTLFALVVPVAFTRGWIPRPRASSVPAGAIGGVLVGLAIGISFLVFVAPIMRRLYRRALQENRICDACGFDMENAPGSACPECGKKMT